MGSLKIEGPLYFQTPPPIYLGTPGNPVEYPTSVPSVRRAAPCDPGGFTYDKSGLSTLTSHCPQPDVRLFAQMV